MDRVITHLIAHHLIQLNFMQETLLLVTSLVYKKKNVYINNKNMTRTRIMREHNHRFILELRPKNDPHKTEHRSTKHLQKKTLPKDNWEIFLGLLKILSEQKALSLVLYQHPPSTKGDCSNTGT